MITDQSGPADAPVPRAGPLPPGPVWASAIGRTLRGRTLRARSTRTGMLLISPAFALVAVFFLFPLGFALYISLTDWPLIGPYHFIGVCNYTDLIQDPLFLHSVLF